MDTVSLKSDKGFDIGALKRLLHGFENITDTPDGGVVIHANGNRVYLHHDYDIGKAKDNVLLLDYSDIEAVKKVIRAIADDAEIWVDNDFGTVLPGDRFVERIKRETGWNWKS